MKHALLILLALLWLGTSASATVRFVRNDGHNTNCDGLVDAADPGSGTIPRACAWASVQVALDAVVAGDTVKVKAGHTFDGTFDLPNKSCTSLLPCTLTSTAAASLPAGRVGPSDAANMPRLRTLGESGLPTLRTESNTAWWIVDGIEITDNAGATGYVPWLINFATGTPGVHDMTIQRCYFHQKETGTNYFRSVERGVGWIGNNLTFKWNYLYLIGYPANTQSMGQPLNTTAITSDGGTNGISGILVEDNYISVWYSAFFFGGQDTSPAHTATLASGATTTQATFSSTTGLVPGAIIILTLNLNATLGSLTPGADGFNHAVMTRNSGAVLTDADAGLYSYKQGTAMRVIGQNIYVDLHDTSGDTYDMTENTSGSHPGTYDFELLTTVMVDSVVGNVVTYHPYGTDRLAQAPSVPGAAYWSVGNEGLVNDITIRKNTFYIDPAFSEHAVINAGQGPKGYWEIKSSNRMTVEGNRFGGWPSLIAWTGSNQNGGSPWTTIKDTIIRNNWFEPLNSATTRPHMRQAIGISVNRYRTGTPASGLQIYNNVIKNLSGLFTATVSNQSITHNTWIYNTYANISQITNSDELQTGGFIFSDNIVPYSGYGLQCYLGGVNDCWLPNTILNNVVIADWTQYVSDVWGDGGILAPVRPANASAIGFTDLAGDILSLAVSSPYKGDGTGNSDPGVDWAVLQAALTGANNPPTAGAGLDQNLGPVTSTTLMGTASDPDGDTPLTYSWTRISGPNTPTIVSSTALTTLITGMTTGTYVFTLTVTDPDGASSSDMVSVTIATSGQITTCRWPTNPVCQP